MIDTQYAKTAQTLHTHDRGLERMNFFPRQMITADDMRLEQDFFRQKLRRHNRFLHGWGVVCGCEVKSAGTLEKPWLVRICPGYVLTPQGDEVMIGCEALFDLATCLVESDDPCAFSRPCPPVELKKTQDPTTVYLAVRYMECRVRPVRVAPLGCGCDDSDCEYSRIRDAYEFCCLDRCPCTDWGLDWECEQFCAKPRAIVPCPECPEDPWVVLARIELPVNRKSQPKIDTMTDCRKSLYSTTVLQQQAECVCERLQPRGSEAAAPQPEATAPQPEAAAPQPEAAAPQPEAAAPQPEAAAPQSDAAAPQPDATPPDPGANAPASEAPPAEEQAEPAGAAVSRPRRRAASSR